MDIFETSHFSRQALRHELKAWDGKDRTTAAVLLSRIAEFEARQIFLEDGYPSMYAYCLHELHYCEGTACRRLYAAKTAHRFPLLFAALAEGRVHLTAVLMLARYLTEGNVGELVAAATHKTKAEIAQLIAERFPRRDLPERLEVVAPWPAAPAAEAPRNVQHSPENVVRSIIPAPPAGPEPVRQHSPENAGAPAHQHSPENVVASPSRMTPLAPQRFAFQFTGDQETHDLYEDVRALLGHELPGGEMALVFKSALKLAQAHLAKRKFAATDHPGTARGSADPRHIPAAVKRAVCERDGRQCIFVSESGKRCASRSMLEYDHIEPVACGGASTVENIRLLCRPHNQHEAERTFGAEFMERKRAEARGRGRGSGRRR